jgi:DNA processing protein
LVVEAGERSGSLSTADHAGDEGREVMAVPGHPTHPAAAGTNRLLCQGAALIRDASDVWAALELPRPARTREAEGEDAVLAALRRGVPASVDEIAARSGCALPDLLARLAELELGGGVRRLPGALFVRS